MNPIQGIKRGIKDRNWESVISAYNAMTGEDLQPPSTEEIDLQDVTMSGIRKIVQDELSGIDFKYNSRKPTDILTALPPMEQKSKKHSKNTDTESDSKIDKSGNYSGNMETEHGNVGYYGNEKRFITGERDDTDAANNQRRAVQKHHRSSPKKFKVKCNECENEFTSRRKGDKEIGQKCPKCLGATRK